MKRYLPVILLVSSAFVLALGIVRLFTLRFQTGDVYPQYSSLRSDPLGTMAFYESLGRLRGFNLQRDYTAENRLPEVKETTYLHLAAPLPSLQTISDSTIAEIERFVNAGGRLVITMSPMGDGYSPTPATSNPAPKPERPPYRERWGVDFEIIRLNRNNDVYVPVVVENTSNLPLPETLPWHSGVVFSNLNPDWTPIYVRDGKPVMIQRTFGRGSVVIATDSYFVSNEAMLSDREAGLLAFLIGPNRNVVFDEAHLGVREDPGMATLMRRYRLHWTGASLILVALLFIWKMSMPLLPRHEMQTIQEYVAGKDTGAGIINLLRRSIPPGDLLMTCFNEWKKSVHGAHSTKRMQQAEAVFQAEISRASAHDPVAVYRDIARILERRIK